LLTQAATPAQLPEVAVVVVVLEVVEDVVFEVVDVVFEVEDVGVVPPPFVKYDLIAAS
jgi:hypothetical protein